MKKPALIFIHLLLLVQVALPLHYYGCREDKNDERFAWRMFSPTRTLQCLPRFSAGEPRRPVPLGGTFHEAWIEIAKRGRLHVIEQMARHLCEDGGGPVFVELECDSAGRLPGLKQSYGSEDMCRGGSL